MICDILNGKSFSESTTKDFIKQKNELLKEMYDAYHSDPSKAKAIEDAIVEDLMNSIEGKKGLSTTYVNSFAKKNVQITRLTSILSLDINTFNNYFYNYFGVGIDEDVDMMPLYDQENAIYDQVAMLTSDSSVIFNRILKSYLDKTISKVENKLEKEHYKNTIIYNNTIRLNGIAGAGKTKLVAGTTIKIAEQINPNNKKTVVTAMVKQISSDIYTEFNNLGINLKHDKPLTLEEIIKSLKNDDDLFDGVGQLVIDEATLFEGYNNTKHETTLSLIHEKLKAKGIKLVLLGDNKQLSYNKTYNIGKSFIDNNVTLTSNPLSNEIIGIQTSKELTDSFRTSSLLLNQPMNKLRNDRLAMSSEKKLHVKHSFSITDKDKLMGIKVTSPIGTKNDNSRGSDARNFINALMSKTNPGYTMMDSLEKQLEKGGMFSLMFVTDSKIKLDELRTELGKNDLGKRFLALLDNGNFDFKLFSDGISSSQGSEADYVVASFTNNSIPKTEIKNEGSFIDYDIKLVNEMAYTAISRARLYVHIINSTDNMFFLDEAEKKPYDVLSTDAKVNAAKEAKKIYDEVFEDTKDNMTDINGEHSVINWDKPTKKEVVKPSENKQSEKEPELKTEETPRDKLIAVANSMPISTTELKIRQQEIIDKIIDESTPMDEARKLEKEKNEIDKVLNARIYLNGMQGSSFDPLESYQKVLDEINKSLENENLTPEEKALEVAKRLSNAGYPYAYNHVKGDSKTKIDEEENSIMASLGIDPDKVSNGVDDKQQALGLKKTDKSFTYNLHIKKIFNSDNSFYYKVYVIATDRISGNNTLVLTTESDKWTNTTYKDIIKKIEDVKGFDNETKSFVAENIEYNSIIEFITPGKIIRNNEPKPITIKEFFTKGNLNERLKDKGINVSSKIFTYTGKNEKLAGKQFLLYSQSDFVAIDEDSFKVWVDKALDEESEEGKFSGFYTNNGKRMKVGMIMLSNAGYTFNQIYNTIKEDGFGANSEQGSFNLLMGYRNQLNITSFFSLLLNEIFEKDNKNKSDLAKVFIDTDNKVLQTDEQKNIFEGALKEMMKDDTEIVYEMSGKTITTTKGKLFKEFLEVIFAIEGNISKADLGGFVYENGKPIINTTAKKYFPKNKDGAFFTVLTDGVTFTDEKGNEKQAGNIYRTKLKGIFTALNQFSGNKKAEGLGIDLMISDILTTLYSKTSYGSRGDGIRTSVKLNNEETIRIEDRVYTTKDKSSANTLSSLDDELLINIKDIGEPNAIININNIKTVIDNEFSLRSNQTENTRIDNSNDITEEETIEEIVEEDIKEDLNKEEEPTNENVFLKEINNIIDPTTISEENKVHYNNLVSLYEKLKGLNKDTDRDEIVNTIYDIYLEETLAKGNSTEFIEENKDESIEYIENLLNNEENIIPDVAIDTLFNKLNCK